MVEKGDDIFVGVVLVETGLCLGVRVGSLFRVDGGLRFFPYSFQKDLFVEAHPLLQLKRFTFKLYIKLNII